MLKKNNWRKVLSWQLQEQVNSYDDYVNLLAHKIMEQADKPPRDGDNYQFMVLMFIHFNYNERDSDEGYEYEEIINTILGGIEKSINQDLENFHDWYWNTYNEDDDYELLRSNFNV